MRGQLLKHSRLNRRSLPTILSSDVSSKISLSISASMSFFFRSVSHNDRNSLFMKVCFSLITKHFASQFGLRIFVSFFFRGFGRTPCRVPLQVQFSLVGNLSVFVLSFLLLLKFSTLVGKLSVFVLSFLYYSLFFIFLLLPFLYFIVYS